MNVLTSITVLGFLIFFHEMGHFLAAILQGIYVDGFSIGFGPSIIQKKYKNITYSFRAFPLGGFVSFPDEELNNIDPKDPNLLKNRPIFRRLGSLGSILLSSSSGKETKPPNGKALNEYVMSLYFFWIIEGPNPIENPST